MRSPNLGPARNADQSVFDVAQAVTISYPLFKPRPVDGDWRSCTHVRHKRTRPAESGCSSRAGEAAAAVPWPPPRERTGDRLVSVPAPGRALDATDRALRPEQLPQPVTSKGFLVLEVVLIGTALFHGLNGVRVAVVGSGIAVRRQRTMFWALRRSRPSASSSPPPHPRSDLMAVIDGRRAPRARRGSCTGPPTEPPACGIGPRAVASHW